MTVSDLQTIGVIIAILIGAFGLYRDLRKLPVDLRVSEADLSDRYRKMQVETQTRLDAVELKVNILRTELDKQTSRANEWQVKAEAVAVENVILTMRLEVAVVRISSLEKTLNNIVSWGSKWEEQLRAAGIEPMPTE
jgi:hypothetical protein